MAKRKMRTGCSKRSARVKNDVKREGKSGGMKKGGKRYPK